MKILLICAAYPPFGKGGGPVASATLAEAIAGQGHDVEVITVSDEPGNYVHEGINVTALSSLNIYTDYWRPRPAISKAIWHLLENFNPRAFFTMLRLLRAKAPDAVMTVSIENINVATWAAARMLKIPLLHWAQSYFAMCWRGSLYQNGDNCDGQCKTCKVATIGRKLSSSLVDVFGAEAQSTIDLHSAAGYFRNASRVVVPGIISSVQPANLTPRITDSKLRVGYLGVHTRNKGIHILAQAAQMLPSDAPLRYVIAGNGDEDYTSELVTGFSGRDAGFLGWVKQSDFYSNIDVLVVPSLWREPFGRVCIEAYSYGIPVLASRIGGLAEVVNEGVSGFRFEAGNALELSQLLQRLSSDRAEVECLSNGAREFAKTFSVEAIGQRIDTIFKNLASR